MGKAGVWARFAVFFFCLFGFGILASILRQHPGFPLDDSWIHQTVARNLVDYHILGYVPGVHSSGSSSLLWTLILAINYQFLPAVNPVAFAAVVNGILLGVIGVTLKIVTEQDGLTPVESWIISLAPILNGNFLWLGVIGMEHVLFVALSIATIGLWYSRSKQRASSYVLLAAVLLALLILTRPEGIFLAGLLLLLKRSAGRSLRDCVVLASAAVVAQLISFRVNWVASHSLLPLTMKGRQFLYLGSVRATQAARMTLLWEWVRRIMKAWTLNEFVRHHLGLELLALASLAGIALLLAETFCLFRERRSRMCALILWAAGVDLLYFLVLPATGHGGRYQSLHLLLLFPLMWAGFFRLLRWASLRFRISAARAYRLAALATVLPMVVSTVATIRTWRTVSGEGVDQIEREHGVMAAWLERNLPQAALDSGKIAVFDIGKIGYVMHGRLVDLGGLTDAGYLPYLMNGRVLEYLQERDISYIVLPTDPSPSDFLLKLFSRSNPPRLQELKTVCVPVPLANEVASASVAAARCQSAYRISFEPGNYSNLSDHR